MSDTERATSLPTNGSRPANLLQDIADREEIRALTSRYCHYVWQKDIRIVDLFTDDGVFANDKSNEARYSRGRESLLKTYGVTFGPESANPQPFIHNHVIELDAVDRAHGWCYLDVRSIRNGQHVIMSGYYEEEYRKVDGQWRFKARLFNPIRRIMVPEGV